MAYLLSNLEDVVHKLESQQALEVLSLHFTVHSAAVHLGDLLVGWPAW